MTASNTGEGKEAVMANPWQTDDLLFVPLGGANEVGMNVNLYHYQDQWLMVDLGIGFPDSSMAGIDVLLPDLRFVKDKQLQAIVLTHGHEDHLGAIPYLWRELPKVPIYGTAFTIALLRLKMKESWPGERPDLRVVDYKTRHTIGAFTIEMLPITHSIPDSASLVVRAGGQTIFHSGDWKFDPTPQLPPLTDKDALRAVGDEGVLAMIGDSTNALSDELSGSEEEARLGLIEAVKQEEKRVAVTCFASNVARLNSMIQAAAAAGRTPMLVGRALHRMVMAAEDCGYLADWPELADVDDYHHIPRDKILLICTGSQGEVRSALTRIAHQSHPAVALQAGDSVLFSSREIPGNEEAIYKIHNLLLAAGIRVITADDAPIHVSGHPGQQDMVEMYGLIRPKLAIPVHGSHRHLLAHAKLAASCQIPSVVTPVNGDIIRLHPGAATIIGKTNANALHTFDGGAVVALDDAAIKTRTRMLWNGTISVSVVVSEEGGLCCEPAISQAGIISGEAEDEFLADVLLEIEDGLHNMHHDQRLNDSNIKRMVNQIVFRLAKKRFNRRPLMFVHIARVAAYDVDTDMDAD